MYVTAACSCTNPLLPLAEENDVPLIGVATANVIGFETSEWAYRFYPGTEAEVSVALDILEERDVASLGIMRADNPLGYELAENITLEFEDRGGTVEAITFCCKDADIAQKAMTLTDNDAIYIAGDFKATKNAIIAIHSLGYEGDVLTMSAASSPEISSMPESDGVFISAPAIYNPNYLPAEDFRQQFLERFGYEMSHFSASGYDLINIIYGLMKDKEMTRQVLNDELSDGFSYPGILGTMRVEGQSHDIQYRLFPAQVVDGELWYL
jgi:ABC-type branched-subunit amino acid transport system substrate-binding protein